MDQRGRDAEKRYRASANDIIYKTISLTLNEKLVKKLEQEVEITDDKNMSRFIEESVSGSKVVEMPVRRESKSFPIKKTFTFSDTFVKEIKKSGNMSLFIENVLTKKFNLK